MAYKLFDIYCDESCHLQNGRDNDFVMVIGGIVCPDEFKKQVSDDIRAIKAQFGIYRDTEIKWNKVSNAKSDYYNALINYFFDSSYLTFRAIIVDKRDLNLADFNLTHDEFYYRAYFLMLRRIFAPNNKYSIYIDIKDTRSQKKVEKLHDVLCNSSYDFDRQMIHRVQQIRSHEVEIMGLTDLLIGALSYFHRGLNSNEAKLALINLIRKRSGYTLNSTTWPLEPKFNILLWHGRKH
ncbi:MAG: DUF3800 domain-containing protein [Barnesiella sp.]|nr:DUF3800 domain-containing protein [Barnesiella sp.]